MTADRLAAGERGRSKSYSADCAAVADGGRRCGSSQALGQTRWVDTGIARSRSWPRAQRVRDKWTSATDVGDGGKLYLVIGRRGKMVRDCAYRRDDGRDGAIIVVKSAAAADTHDGQEDRSRKQDRTFHPNTFMQTLGLLSLFYADHTVAMDLALFLAPRQ